MKLTGGRKVGIDAEEIRYACGNFVSSSPAHVGTVDNSIRYVLFTDVRMRSDIPPEGRVSNAYAVASLEILSSTKAAEHQWIFRIACIGEY